MSTIVFSIRLAQPAKASAESSSATVRQPDKEEISRKYGKLPLSFERNDGQLSAEVRFLAHGPGYEIFLTEEGAVLQLRNQDSVNKGKSASVRSAGSMLKLKLIGSNPAAQFGEELLSGKINYLVGDDPKRWRVNVPTYRKVRYKDVYSGVDLIFYGNQRELEYDLVVAPGGDPNALRFQLGEADDIRTDESGDLHLRVNDDFVILRKPMIYQVAADGEHNDISGEYVVRGKEIGFNVGAYDQRKSLVIDPILSYSTLVGGGGTDNSYSIAVDSSGSAYIAGNSGGGFPTTEGAFQTTGSQYGSAFVTKLDPTGTSLVYSTYLAGTIGGTAGASIAIDGGGNAYVTGTTQASDFPIVNPIRGGNFNLFSTLDGGVTWGGQFIGGTKTPTNALAVDPLAPNTIYAGMAGSGIYKTTNGGVDWIALNTGVTNATCRAIVIDPTTPATLYASLTNEEAPAYLYKSTDEGGTWAPRSNGIFSPVSALLIDPAATNVIYAGTLNSGVYKSTNGGASWVNSLSNIPGFSAALTIDPANSQTIYVSSGGSAIERTTNAGASWVPLNTGIQAGVKTLVIDSNSTIYAGTSGTGVFKSTDAGANWSPANNGMPGAVNVSSMALTSTTLYAGTIDGQIFKTINSGNNWTKVFETITRTNFTAMVIKPGATSTVYAATSITSATTDYEGFVTKLNPSGSGLVYSTYLGGNADDFPHGIAVDSSGNAVVVGQTNSTTFPIINAIHSSLSGFNDAFITKINAAGSALVYSTYLGGGSMESANAVAVDSTGNAYVTGNTTSTDFPTLNAFQSTIGDSAGDVFATRLSSNGALSYSTYLGGDGSDIGYGIAVDGFGNAYITGVTSSSNFPLLNPIQPLKQGSITDAFITKLNNAGSGLMYSTFLGGTGNESGRAIAVDSIGNAYVTGATDSTDFPILPGTLKTRSSFFTSVDSADHWDNENFGMTEFPTVVAVDPVQTFTVYAGTRSNILKSTNSGRTWTPSSSGLTSPSVTSLVIAQNNPSILYAGMGFTQNLNNLGVYKSTDAGKTWNSVNNPGLANSFVNALAIDPVDPNIVYAGVLLGIYKTVNGGATWTLLGGTTVSSVTHIAVDPITPTTVFATGDGSGGGVFRSTNGGIDWQVVNQDGSGALAIDPLTPTTIYAGGSFGIVRSTNGGDSWSFVYNGSFTFAIAVDPITPNTVYASTGGVNTGGIIKSTDGGNSWVFKNNGLSSLLIAALVVDPTKSSRVYASVQALTSDMDAFAVKINSSGTSLAYSTLLGGRLTFDTNNFLDEFGWGIAVDSSGNAYVTGSSDSKDFLVTSNSYQPYNRGSNDAFISKLSVSYQINGTVHDSSNSTVVGADIILNDGVSVRSLVTEGDGSYQFVQLREGGTFTVSAAKPHFTMTPNSQTFSNLQSDQTADFVATPTIAPFYLISGFITDNGMPLKNVVLNLTGSQLGVATTDVNGAYSFILAGGGNYTITPSLLDYSFNPTSRSFNNLSSNQTADFAATRQDIVVVNTNDHGPGSLRQAILDANNTVGLDKITFNIPGAGVHTISLRLGLPTITDPVVIDGTTQPGFSGTPLIEIDGTEAGSQAHCFEIVAGSSLVRGFVINSLDGPAISLSGVGNNIVQGNYLGTDPTGTLRRGNGYGVFVFSSNNLIGGTTASARNVISGNDEGIEVRASNNVIQGNYIGVDPSGTVAVFNGEGIRLESGTSSSGNNLVGGTTPGARNVISGNLTGMLVRSSNNIVQGNFIGTDLTGTLAISQNGVGLDMQGPGNTIGGTTPEARNIISGNGLGISLGASSPAHNVVQGNFIGTDVTGHQKVGNSTGIDIHESLAIIGGTAAGAGNLISGNTIAGISMNGSGTPAIIGNLIGTDVTGENALGNATGVSLSSGSGTIGGTEPGSQNVISGNTTGIKIFSGFGTSIKGNLIGLNKTGNAAVPNTSAGINLFSSSSSQIGGAENGEGNLIGFNGGPGVVVFFGSGNSIRGNSIFSNAGLGIDLSPNGVTLGVTANDPCDTDSGANNLQNYPVLTSASSSSGNVNIQGTLNSVSNTSYKIDFYASSSCDASGFGEGQVFLGSTTVATNASCNAIITGTFPLPISSAQVITATATDPNGNTSEFSHCVPICSFELSTLTASFSNVGGVGTVDVTCAASCSWSAVSNNNWITITSGSNGSGNGQVGYLVGANDSGGDRIGTITIAEQTVTINQSNNPTAIKLVSFDAMAYSDGVLLEWKTGFEIGNLGFHVFREQNGQRTRITPEIVAGSALIAGERTRLTAGQTYRWWDPTLIDCISKHSDCEGISYWLEDIGLDGTHSLHRPIKPRIMSGQSKDRSRAALLSTLGNSETSIRQVSEREAESAVPFIDLQPKSPWAAASKQGIKITVKGEGWYRITQQELISAGLDPGTDPRNLQLYVNGEEQAMLVSGEQDGHLDQSDSVEFYGTGQDLPYTDARVYWLVSGERTGKRVRVIKSEAKPVGASSFPFTIERKERSIYFAALRNGDAENFFGRVVADQPVEQQLSLQNIDPTSEHGAMLEVALQGVTTTRGGGPNHQVKVTLNEKTVGTMVFDGSQHQVLSFSIPRGVLNEGGNIVTLVSLGGPSDISLVDYLRISYQHKYAADHDSLRISANAVRTVEGFSNSSVRVIDITRQQEPRELVGLIEDRRGSFAVTFQVDGDQTARLLAFTDGEIKHPISVIADQPSTLKDKDHKADLLILTRSEFFNAVAPLATLRRQQGYLVEMVDVEDVYDEFGFGQKSPGAIKDFLAFIRANWERPPRFVLLAGEASYDPRNYLGAGNFDLVPTKLIDTAYLETASDDWFVDFDDDGLPEMSIGRLPFRNVSEAAIVVSKLVAYDSNLSKEVTQRRSVLLVADRNDEFDFERASRQLKSLLPPGTNFLEIFRGRMDDSSAKNQLISAINTGQSIVNYSGHGSTNSWRSLLDTSDVESMYNEKALPLFVTMTCLNGFFHDPANESLAAALLRSPRGGAVAVWASSGLTVPDQQVSMNQRLFRSLFGDQSSLGEIIARAKRSTGDSDVRRTWILFGDPTMVLR